MNSKSNVSHCWNCPLRHIPQNIHFFHLCITHFLTANYEPGMKLGFETKGANTETLAPNFLGEHTTC